jgi:hypothetical protein
MAVILLLDLLQLVLVAVEARVDTLLLLMELLVDQAAVAAVAVLVTPQVVLLHQVKVLLVGLGKAVQARDILLAQVAAAVLARLAELDLIQSAVTAVLVLILGRLGYLLLV